MSEKMAQPSFHTRQIKKPPSTIVNTRTGSMAVKMGVEQGNYDVTRITKNDNSLTDPFPNATPLESIQIIDGGIEVTLFFFRYKSLV